MDISKKCLECNTPVLLIELLQECQGDEYERCPFKKKECKP